MSIVEQNNAAPYGQADDALALDEPVFVLTCARSGSTLLRMILDAHADLACPPETNVAKLCTQLWEMWTLLNPECSRTFLTEQALTHIRGTVNSAFKSYLISRGKVRWCEKSLGTIDVAERFLNIYDKAKFICLYRHAMDVVNSGLDASPWGLQGYGFDQFVRPGGNSVTALVSYWMDLTTRTLEFEEAHKDRCLRVHYEQLVTEPERVAAEIFDFIGVGPAPDITRYALLDQERPDIFGFGDHKIRAVNQIIDSSLGKGIRLPVHVLAPGQVIALNQVLARLGYTEVNRAWQMATCPPSLLARPAERPTNAVADDDIEAAPTDAVQANGSVEISDSDPRSVRFQYFDDGITGRITRAMTKLPVSLQKWHAVGIVAYSTASPRVAQAWRIDCQADDITSDLDVDFESLDADWVFTGEIDVWLSLLDGRENLAAALRHGYVRCIGKEMAGDTAAQDNAAEGARGLMDLRIRMVTHLLELGSSDSVR